MLKSVIRAIAAVVAAGVIAGGVALVSGANGTLSASAPLNSGKGDRLDIRAIGPQCSEQAWPYYEAHCVKDRRKAMSQAAQTRTVTADRARTTLRN